MLHILKEKWVHTADGWELHLFFDTTWQMEMGQELGEDQKEGQERLTQSALAYVRERYATASLNSVRVFLGSLLLANVTFGALGGGETHSAQAASFAHATLQLVINGQKQTAGQPILKQGSMLVPANQLAKSLGAELQTDAQKRQLTFRKQGNEVSVRMGDTLATINGNSVQTVAPVLLREQSYVPIRLISEGLQAKVAWNPQLDTVAVGSKPNVVYRVQSGDSLWSIARAHDTSVEAIRQLNGLPNTDVLQAGVELLVPVAATPYVIQAGDSLYKLAQQYGTTVASIRSVSNLTTDTLHPGQTIYIPSITLRTMPAADEARDLTPSSALLAQADPKARTHLAKTEYRFPIPQVVGKRFEDTYQEARTWNPDGTAPRAHEGIDIFAPEGTPVVSVGSGRVTRYGWNPYGGWRITIQLDNTPYAIYYAHFSRYAPGLREGSRIEAGQVIGYVGSTGYGPEGTSGKFLPHLHIGIYDTERGFAPINPFPFLRYWQEQHN